MNKIAGIVKQDSGVGFYRIAQPLAFLKRDKLVKEVRITPSSGHGITTRISENDNPDSIVWTDKMLMEMCKDSSVIWSTMMYDIDEMLKIMNLRKWSGAKWIVDIDDDLYSISSDNPSKNSVEKVTGLFETCLKLCDGVTVSVPSLVEVYKHLNPNIYVNPNGLDFDEIWNSEGDKNKGKIRIGWRGAYGHTADLQNIEPVLRALQKDYDVQFVTFGSKPNFKSEHHGFVHLPEYPKMLASLALDIAVVPLIDSDYNKAKSNVGILEFSALRIPVVASPTKNQLNMPISYASSNFEWYQELEKLIKDPKLRRKQGIEQWSFVKKNFNVSNFSHDLCAWMEKLPRKDI